mgnify:CR=1 FL=1
MVSMGEAISPYGQEEPEVGGEAIPPALAGLLEFLEEDLRIGVEYVLVRSPREVLEDAIRNGEWFKGMVLATAFF